MRSDRSSLDGSDRFQNGAVFFAAGVFYYLKRSDVKALFCELAKRFPGGIIVFDTCNRIGAKMMTKTWLTEAVIANVDALFYLNDENELKEWADFRSVSAKSYMRGYRDIYPDVSFVHKLMIRLCDSIVKMKIVKIEF